MTEPLLLRVLTTPSTKQDPGANTNFYVFESGFAVDGEVVEANVKDSLARVMMMTGYSVSAFTTDGKKGNTTLLSFQAEDDQQPDLFAIAQGTTRDNKPDILHVTLNKTQFPESLMAQLPGRELATQISLPAALQPYLAGWQISNVERAQGKLIVQCRPLTS